MTFGLPEGYNRQTPRPWDDFGLAPGGVIWQPKVYDHAADRARELGADAIVDVGCGTAAKLRALDFDGRLIGLDTEATVARLRGDHPDGNWIPIDLETAPVLPATLCRGAVLVCADVIEHLWQPDHLLALLADALDCGALAVILSTPDRDRARGWGDLGPPANKAHAQEWTREELASWIADTGLTVHWSGWTQTKSSRPAENTILIELR